MHWVHAGCVGRTPWGWRDGVVRAIRSQEGLVEVMYLGSDSTVLLWHHQDLSAELELGQLLRVHEEYHALGAPFGWLNVLVQRGLGPVPTPDVKEAWASEATVAVQDMSTGRGIAMDHWQGSEQ